MFIVSVVRATCLIFNSYYDKLAYGRESVFCLESVIILIKFRFVR